VDEGLEAVKLWLRYDRARRSVELDWPDELRVPAVGEMVTCAPGQFTIRDVQWFMPDAEAPFLIVQLIADQ
jgi:hypothetical protein